LICPLVILSLNKLSLHSAYPPKKYVYDLIVVSGSLERNNFRRFGTSSEGRAPGNLAVNKFFLIINKI